MNTDVMLFFSKAPGALPLYERLEGEILSRFPETTVTVQKSLIAFGNGKRRAAQSFTGDIRQQLIDPDSMICRAL